MKIEFHHGHGNQLIMRLNTYEAAKLLSGVSKSLNKVLGTKVRHYTKFETEFEDDNDRWEPTELDIVVQEDDNDVTECVLVDNQP